MPQHRRSSLAAAETEPSRRHGFTLNELLAVLAIITVLAVLAVPVSRYMRGSTLSAACVANLRQLGAALQVYLNDHDQIMPTMEALRADKEDDVPVIDNTLDEYVKDPRLFACPADAGGLAEESGTSYHWNSLLNGQRAFSLDMLGMIKDASRIPVLADKEAFHRQHDPKVNILYADGHAARELRFFVDE